MARRVVAGELLAVWARLMPTLAQRPAGRQSEPHLPRRYGAQRGQHDAHPLLQSLPLGLLPRQCWALGTLAFGVRHCGSAGRPTPRDKRLPAFQAVSLDGVHGLSSALLPGCRSSGSGQPACCYRLQLRRLYVQPPDRDGISQSTACLAPPPSRPDDAAPAATPPAGPALAQLRAVAALAIHRRVRLPALQALRHGRPASSRV